ncbi:MAG: hypothetical protein ACPGVH_03830 [Chitinophagales bacterium]
MKRRIFNSTIYLVTAFYLCNIAYVLSQFFILKLLNFDRLKLYFFYNSYLAKDATWWTRIKVYLVCGIGIATISAILFIAIISFIKLSRKKHRLQVFYNWLIIVASSIIIAEFVAASFYTEYTNMYFLLRWSNFDHLGSGMYIVTIFALITIPFLAYFTSKYFLKMTNTTKHIKTKSSRLKFYFQTAFIPYFVLVFIFAFLINSVYSYESNYFMSREVMRLAVLGLVLLFGVFFNFNKNYISIQKTNNTHKVNIALSLFLTIAMSAYFVVLYINH